MTISNCVVNSQGKKVCVSVRGLFEYAFLSSELSLNPTMSLGEQTISKWKELIGCYFVSVHYVMTRQTPTDTTMFVPLLKINSN